MSTVCSRPWSRRLWNSIVADARSSTAFFVTGSDTAVGKTLVATGLLLAARKRGMRTLGVKPVSAGCELRGEQLVNSDALALQNAATVALDYPAVNPVALEPFLAPHIAAVDAGIELSAADLIEHVARQWRIDADLMIVEGAGGWLVPLNAHETMADVCHGLDMPAVMVVNMRLGCLNHALLTAAAISAAGVRLAGWVANSVNAEMTVLDENLQTLRARLAAPQVGEVPYMGAVPDAEDIIDFLDLDTLLSATETRSPQPIRGSLRRGP